MGARGGWSVRLPPVTLNSRTVHHWRARLALSRAPGSHSVWVDTGHHTGPARPPAGAAVNALCGCLCPPRGALGPDAACTTQSTSHGVPECSERTRLRPSRQPGLTRGTRVCNMSGHRVLNLGSREFSEHQRETEAVGGVHIVGPS